MQAYWHKMGCHCPKCEKELTLTGVYYASDGQIRLDWYCMKCAKPHESRMELIECVKLAFTADMEQSFMEEPA